MTALDSASPCALCSRSASVTIEPERRALGRGLDPDDPSQSVTVMLPDVSLCSDHAFDVRAGSTLIGWCDNEHCRIYGEVGEKSPCGQPYKRLLARRKR